MKDKAGRILYVGKAVSLRNRVKSYFTRGAPSPKVTSILRRLENLDYILTGSELEALILESNLIKKWRPPYNVILRDDKQYPYLKLTLNEEFPRLLVVRRILPDGARYFGPFKGGMVRETIRLVKKLFPIRWCKETPMKKRQQPCLQFHIKRCVGPCIQAVDKATYDRLVNQLILFLEGRLEEASTKLRQDMGEAAKTLQYERASDLRDRLRILQKMAEGQKVLSRDLKDRDVLAMASLGTRGCLTIFKIRKGKLIGKESYYLEDLKGETFEKVMGGAVSQYYRDAAFIPKEIILEREMENQKLLEGWLKPRRKGVRIIVPQRGTKKELVSMVAENARSQLEQKVLVGVEEPRSLQELKRILGFPKLPLRIEAFDVSNILGTDVVGAMVVFQEGKPYKRDYRRFKIKRVEAQSDVAAIQEIVYRRYSQTLRKELELPDLILVDGGMGQGRAAEKALSASKLKDIPIIALAKKRERIYSSQRRGPLQLPRRSKVLQLLQRVRDEAHRFAISYHRLRRGKRLFS